MADSVRARPSEQALAVPATPADAVDGPSGFDPSRIEFIFDAAVGSRHLRSGYFGITVGWPDDAGLWWLCDERRWVTADEASRLGLAHSNTAPCASFAAFRRHVRKHWHSFHGQAPRLLSRWHGHDVTAIATAAGTDETRSGSAEGKGAAPQGDRPNTGTPQSDERIGS